VKSVLLRLEGPGQSWGVQSRFTERDTRREPTKSGVVGLICAALGIARDDERALAPLAAMRMAVRVDREGIPARDFQTAGGGPWPGRMLYGVYKASGEKPETVTSSRHYLADASFLVALGGDDALAESIDAALSKPKWSLYLGRRAFAPSVPVRAGLFDGAPDEAVRSQSSKKGAQATVRLIVECEPGEGQPVADVPLSFRSSARHYGTRYVRVEWLSD